MKERLMPYLMSEIDKWRFEGYSVSHIGLPEKEFNLLLEEMLDADLIRHGAFLADDSVDFYGSTVSKDSKPYIVVSDGDRDETKPLPG